MTDLNLTGVAQRPAPHVLPLAFFAFVVYGLPANALGVAWLRMADEFGRTLESLGLLLAVLMLGNPPDERQQWPPHRALYVGADSAWR